MAEWNQRGRDCCIPASTGTRLVPAVRIPANGFVQAGSHAAVHGFCTARSGTKRYMKGTWKGTVVGRPLATKRQATLPPWRWAHTDEKHIVLGMLLPVLLWVLLLLVHRAAFP